jgi:hypothetical protein
MAFSEYPKFVYDLTRLDHTMLVNDEEEEKEAVENGYSAIPKHPKFTTIEAQTNGDQSPVRNTDQQFPMMVYKGKETFAVVADEKQLMEHLDAGWTKRPAEKGEKTKSALEAEILQKQEELDALLALHDEKKAEKGKPDGDSPAEEPKQEEAGTARPGDKVEIKVGRDASAAYKCPTCSKSCKNINEYNKHLKSHRTSAQV